MFRAEGVDRHDVRPQPGHRFGHQPAAATDIEQTQARQRLGRQRIPAEMLGQPVADIGQAHWVEFVERPEFAVRIPPFLCHCREARNLGGIDAGAGGGVEGGG